MATLDAVKYIDQQDKDCVYGYVKSIQALLPTDNVYYTISALIIHWILLYYHEKEQFDAKYCNPSIMLTDNNKCASMTHLKAKSPSSFHKMMMLKNVMTSGVHEWKFKRVETDIYIACFGVYKCNHLSKVDLTKDVRDKYYKGRLYALSTDGHRTYGDTRSTKYIGGNLGRNNDICQMTLDLNQRELRYKFNSDDLGVVFKKIEQTQYKACVAGYGDEQKYTLLSYERLA